MGAEELIVISEDGARHTLRLFEPTEAGRHPVLLCLPAMGVAAEYYTPFAEMLASGNQAVAAPRGVIGAIGAWLSTPG